MNRVVADEKLGSEATTLAERLARGATLAFAAGKKIVRAYLEGGIRSADSMVDDITPALFESADMRDAVEGKRATWISRQSGVPWPLGMTEQPNLIMHFDAGNQEHDSQENRD